jgi:nucleoside-diphosphate-sugar epimerase
VSVPRSIEEPLRANEVNVTGTLCVLEAARRAGVRRVVLASSAAVYGAAAPPLDESAPTVPLSPYGAHKLMAEHYGRLYSELHGVEVVSLRYFNVFGPRQDPSSPYSGVLSRFADALATGRPPAIHGDGLQTRDFVYVGDVARANVAAIQAGPQVAGRVFNVATGQSRTIREAFEVTRDVLGVSIDPDYGPGRPGDVRHSVADVSRIQDAFGWRAETTFREGIRELLGMPAPAR